MKFQVAPLFIAILATSPLAMAQPIEGTREVTLGGAGTSDKDFDNNIFNAEGTYGVYRTSEVVLGVRQSLGVSKIQDQDSNWNGSTSGFVDYHFGRDMYRPYVGASLGYIYGESIEESFIAGPEVGLKAYVADNTFVGFNVAYQFLFESADDADSQVDDGAFAYSLGMGFNF